MEDKVFNAEQRRVIEADGGHHLVLAPPGCGKTAVLAERIAYAHGKGVAFADMACLTFTNRAARGMRERIQERLGSECTDDLDSLFVGNIHRFCLHFLFDSGHVPQHTTVIDTDTSISILAEFMGEDELHALDDNRSRQNYSQIINLQHLMRQCRDGYPSRLMVHRDALMPKLLRELCQAFGLEYTQRSAIQLYMQADHYRSEHVMLSAEARQLLQQLYAAREYECYKQRSDLLDFEDLLLNSYDAMAVQEERQYRRFRWLQIDEVQDLNPLQLAIVDLFAAPEATVVYLGDAQQAIFSFMGAKTDTLALLRKRCGDGHFHNFFQNYRSPQYLLDIFNRYAQWQLGIDTALLPTTQNHEECRPGDIQLLEAQTSIDEANIVARLVRQHYDEHPSETVAVVVAFNSDADDVSAALGDLPHFKISGTDFFATAHMRLLLAHLGVLAVEHNFIAWSHILSGAKVYASGSSARQAVRAMMQLAISPSDLLVYDGTTYVAEYVKAYEESDIVVFDTETTGLEVSADDVVQLAAVRVRRGRVVDELNIFVETSRDIPLMLGDTPNPLIDEYRRHPHLTHGEAMQRFVDFAHGAAILGHNATYDYQIMEHNMRRYAPHLSMAAQWPQYLDTLKLAHLLHPRQKSYKLRDLLAQLGLEGENSHLANDDIMATLSLATHCYELGRSITGRQLEFLSRHRSMAARFRQIYAPLYRQGVARLYTQWSMAQELQQAYRYFKDGNCIPELPKLGYIIRYIEIDMLALGAPELSSATPATPATPQLLASQLAAHYSDLCTMKEADLCGSASMNERVFVSTVHKAKGLEFDTVIVYDAVDGKYPSTYANDNEKRNEEARKFYVAISRAKRRLIVSYCHNTVSRWGAWYSKVLTPYMTVLKSHFLT